MIILQHIDAHIIDKYRNIQLPDLSQPLLKVTSLPRTLVIHHERANLYRWKKA